MGLAKLFKRVLTSDDGRPADRRVVARRVLTGWMGLVSLYFLWEADRYLGAYAWLAEHQFQWLGEFFPTLTYAFLVVLATSPMLVLLRVLIRRDRRREPWRDPVVHDGSLFTRMLVGLAVVFGAASLLTLLSMLTLPRIGAPRAIVVVGSASSAAPPLGAIVLRGAIDYTRTSAVAQTVLGKPRGTRFAPMFATNNLEPGRIRYFVELQPEDASARDTPFPRGDQSGVLVRNGLPGSIVRLYRYAGFTVERPFYVLYTTGLSLRRPYLTTAVQFLLASLLTLLAMLLYRLDVRRIARRRGTPAEAIAPNESSGG